MPGKLDGEKALREFCGSETLRRTDIFLLQEVHGHPRQSREFLSGLNRSPGLPFIHVPDVSGDDCLDGTHVTGTVARSFSSGAETAFRQGLFSHGLTLTPSGEGTLSELTAQLRGCGNRLRIDAEGRTDFDAGAARRAIPEQQRIGSRACAARRGAPTPRGSYPIEPLCRVRERRHSNASAGTPA